MHRRRPGSICNTVSLKNIEDSGYSVKRYISFVECHTPEIFSDEQLAHIKSNRLRALLASYLSYILKNPKDIQGRASIKRILIQNENKRILKHCSPITQMVFHLACLTPDFAAIIYAVSRKGKRLKSMSRVCQVNCVSLFINFWWSDFITKSCHLF